MLFQFFMVADAFGLPTQILCKEPTQVNCLNLATYGLEESYTPNSHLPTMGQLHPLLKHHRASSRRAKKVIVSPISLSDNSDWLVTLGQENEVILIGEEHHLMVTQALQVQMVKVLIEQANYRQVVIEMPYSITPLLNAYIRIANDEEAFTFINQYLRGNIHFPDIIALLNTVRQYNLQHSEQPIQFLASDIEHSKITSYNTSDAFIKALKVFYSTLSIELFPKSEHEEFYAQAKLNFEATASYYNTGNVMDKIRQERIEANLTGQYGITKKSILIGGSLHFKLGPACEEDQLGEGCFLDYLHSPTRGRVGNIRIVALGYYKNPSMGQDALNACKGTVIGESFWASSQEVWLDNFSEWGDIVYHWRSYWSPFEKALRWHGLEHQAQPVQIEDIHFTIRMPRFAGTLTNKWLSYYDETLIIPFDTWSTPLCALTDQ